MGSNMIPYAPQDPMENASRMIQLKELIQNEPVRRQILQQQADTGQLGLEQERMQVAGTKAMMRAYTESQGDLDKTWQLAAKYGAMPQQVIGLRQAGIEMRTKMAQMTKDEIENLQNQNDAALEGAKVVKAAPPEKRPAVYQQQLQNLSKVPGMDLSKYPQQYPGDEVFDMLHAGLVGSSQRLAAQARMKQAEKQPEGEMAFPEDKRAQLNALLLQRYQASNPKATTLGPYELRSGATQKDFDRIDKMLQQTESGIATQAQRDIANNARQQTLELARQGLELRRQGEATREEAEKDRQERQGLKWVQWQNPETGKWEAGPLSLAKERNVANPVEIAGTEQKDIFNARASVQLMTKRGDPNKPETQGVLQLIDSLEKDGKLGILSSRFNRFMTQRVGAAPSDDPRIVALINKNMLADTATMLAHFGASGGRSPQMLQHFIDLANAGKMDGATLRGGIMAMADYMQDRAMLPSTGAATQQQRTYTPPAGAPTATGPGGRKAVLDNGHWVDFNTGQPIQ